MKTQLEENDKGGVNLMGTQEISHTPVLWQTTEEQTAPEYRVGCEMKAPIPGRSFSNFGISITVTDTDYNYAKDMAVGSTLKEFHLLEQLLATHSAEEILEMYADETEPKDESYDPVDGQN